MNLTRIGLLLLFMILPLNGVLSEDYLIDPIKNCIFLNDNTKQNEKLLKVKLDLNTEYVVELSGEAYLSEQTGNEADPFPGVVLFYCSDGQDGYATQYYVLKPGTSLKYRTPSVDPDNVFILAFLLDYWPGSRNTGKYMLSIKKN